MISSSLYTESLENARLKLQNVNLQHYAKKKKFYEHVPFEEMFPIYGVVKIKQGSSKCTT
jgi:hypothetical protein